MKPHVHAELIKAWADLFESPYVDAAIEPESAPSPEVCPCCHGEGMVTVELNEHHACTLCQDITDDSAEDAAPSPVQAQPPKLPKWIDDLKGSDPTMDGLIEYIEGKARPASKTTPASRAAASHVPTP